MAVIEWKTLCTMFKDLKRLCHDPHEVNYFVCNTCIYAMVVMEWIFLCVTLTICHGRHKVDNFVYNV